MYTLLLGRQSGDRKKIKKTPVREGVFIKKKWIKEIKTNYQKLYIYIYIYIYISRNEILDHLETVTKKH